MVKCGFGAARRIARAGVEAIVEAIIEASAHSLTHETSNTIVQTTATESLIEREVGRLVNIVVAASYCRLADCSWSTGKALSLSLILSPEAVIRIERGTIELMTPSIIGASRSIKVVLQLCEGLLRDLSDITVVAIGRLTKVLDR